MRQTFRIVLLALLLAIFGCATPPRTPTGIQSVDLAEQPMRDAGIARVQNSPALHRALSDPYALPDPTECEYLRAEIGELNVVLGPDLNQLDAGEANGDTEVNAMLSAQMRGLVNIPYTDPARWISGMGPTDREIRRTIVAGTMRRSFLKGVAFAMDCGLEELAHGPPLPWTPPRQLTKGSEN